MPKFPKVTVDKRTVVGRKVKSLRRQGLIPGNVFGHNMKSVAIQLPLKSFIKLYQDVGETGIVDIAIGDHTYPSLITGIAKDPVAGTLLHVDFHHVSLKEKVTATIPVHVVGEAPAVKSVGGVLTQNLHEVVVEALPTDLPEAIEVDVAGLAAIGDSLTISDLKLPEGVVIQAEPETAVVSITEPAKEEVVEAPAETAEVPAEAAAPEAPAEAEAPKSE